MNNHESIELESVKLVVGYRDPATGILYDRVLLSEMDGASEKLLTKKGDTSILHRMTLVVGRNLVSAAGPDGAVVDFKTDKTPKSSAFAAGLVQGDRSLILARLGMLSYGNAGQMKATCTASIGRETDGSTKRCSNVERIYVSPTAIGVPKKKPEPAEDAAELVSEDLIAVETEAPDFTEMLVPGEFKASFLIYRDKDRRFRSARANSPTLPDGATVALLVKYTLDTGPTVDLAAAIPDTSDPWYEALARLSSITDLLTGSTYEFTRGTVTNGVAKFKPEDEEYVERLPIGVRRMIPSTIGAIRDAHWDWQITYQCKKCKSQQSFDYDPFVAFLGLIAT